jgi:hypothetical protein
MSAGRMVTTNYSNQAIDLLLPRQYLLEEIIQYAESISTLQRRGHLRLCWISAHSKVKDRRRG